MSGVRRKFSQHLPFLRKFLASLLRITGSLQSRLIKKFCLPQCLPSSNIDLCFLQLYTPFPSGVALLFSYLQNRGLSSVNNSIFKKNRPVVEDIGKCFAMNYESAWCGTSVPLLRSAIILLGY